MKCDWKSADADKLQDIPPARKPWIIPQKIFLYLMMFSFLVCFVFRLVGKLVAGFSDCSLSGSWKVSV